LSGRAGRRGARHSAGRYSPENALGGDACRLTTLYRDFLALNREQSARNTRMILMLANPDKRDRDEPRRVGKRLGVLRDAFIHA